MKYVDQSLLVERDGNGDCWSACLASLLGVPLDSLPRDMAIESAQDPQYAQTWSTQRWLAGMDLDISWRDFTHPACPPVPYALRDRPLILVGPSPRDRFMQHAVVGMIRCVDRPRDDWVVLHDPHPSRAGILSLSQAWWLVRPQVEYGGSGMPYEADTMTHDAPPSGSGREAGEGKEQETP